MHSLGRALLAGFGSGLIGVMTSWLITGVLFHRFQKRTPGTWRSGEGTARYAGASALTILSAVVISVTYALVGGTMG